MAEEYQPGVCNIGKRERMKRYALGFGGIGAVFLLAGFKVFLRMPDAVTLVLFIPFLAAFEGFIQGRSRFCAGYASQGVYDVSENGDNTSEVDDEESRRKDLQKAKKIHIYSAAGATAATLIAYIVAVIF